MENISIRLEKEWFCLQEGFEWNNIPRLAIITGINGAGKTHLFRLLSNIGDNQPHVINHPVSIVNSNSNETTNIYLPGLLQDKTIEGLIYYHNDRQNRKGRLVEFNNQKNNIKSNIADWKEQLKTNIDSNTEGFLTSNIFTYENEINRITSQIRTNEVYVYDQELNCIAKELDKSVEEITEKDIKNNANRIFNNLNDFNDLKMFVSQNEANKNDKRVRYCKELDFDKITEIENEKKPHELINELFYKYGFTYFRLKDPYKESSTWDGRLIFVGNLGEEIEFENLSSGEQMIVQFVIWAMGKDQRGNRINTMVLDEPDAHLHPKMCKMMVEILDEISKPKELGGSDIRIIITTHSPSTVAFAPEGSLFVLEKDMEGKRSIRKTESKQAIQILSEGIFTFDQAIDSFKLIANSNKKLIVCTEGKTDVVHIKTALDKLNRQLELEIIDLHDAGTLANFIKSTPSFLFGDKKVLAVFDNDSEGQKANSINGIEVNGYKKITAEQCKGKSFTCLIPLPDQQMDKYCPIEFLYSKELLNANEVLEKRKFQEFTALFKASSPEESDLISKEYTEELTLRPFKVKDNIKNQFAEKVDSFGVDAFSNFIPLFDIFEKIINENNPH